MVIIWIIILFLCYFFIWAVITFLVYESTRLPKNNNYIKLITNILRPIVIVGLIVYWIVTLVNEVYYD